MDSDSFIEEVLHPAFNTNDTVRTVDPIFGCDGLLVEMDDGTRFRLVVTRDE